MTRRYFLLACVLAGVVATASACGGKTPVGPGPIVTNTPPVIGTFTVQGTRANEPPNFADMQEELPISVEVTDAESNVSDLKYNWSAAVGTFTGTGRSVVWKAPADGTPGDITINLEVVETFTSQGRSVDNKVVGSTTVSLHDSVKEVGDLARQFLLDFSNSSLPTSEVMRNFEPTCYGTNEEIGDVDRNRADYTIIQSEVGVSVTSVRFGGICAFRAKRGDGCARVPVYWKSLARRDIYTSSGALALRTGQQTEAWGFDHLAAMYYRDQKRWRLCDSQFEGTSTSLRGVSSSALDIIRGMVP